jgi:hypothetical protein
MEPLKDAGHFYEVERRQYHAQRPGFRISELPDFIDAESALALFR